MFDSVAPDVKTTSRRLGAEGGGDLLPRGRHGALGRPAVGVLARGGVSELARQPREHRLEDARVERRRRLVVQVDGPPAVHGKATAAARPLGTGS